MILLQAIDHGDQLAHRVHGEDRIAPGVHARWRWSVRIGPAARDPHRRSILQANDELMLAPDADWELLSLERVMPACYPDLRRRILEDMFSR